MVHIMRKVIMDVCVYFRKGHSTASLILFFIDVRNIYIQYLNLNI